MKHLLFDTEQLLRTNDKWKEGGKKVEKKIQANVFA